MRREYQGTLALAADNSGVANEGMSQVSAQLIKRLTVRTCSRGVMTRFPVRALMSLRRLAKNKKSCVRDSRALAKRGDWRA